MDRRSGRTSSNGGKRSTSSRARTSKSSETRKIRTVSDETKKYKFDENELRNASTKVRKPVKNGKKGKKKNSKKNKVWSVIKKILIAILILGILAGLIFFGFFGADFKMTKEDLTIEFSNSEVYDADGNLLCELNGNEKRKIISLEQMPEYLPKAYVAIEDERFYEHSGVDIKRTGAATVTYLVNGGKSSFGGSTITQQLVKNITDEDEDSALRKVKEMADIAHSYGATIEGELGHVGDNPDSAEGSSHINPADFYTDPKMAKDFVDKTGVDALAIAVGTAHGAYKLPPKLDFERIHTIANTVDVPLVLHGGSGLTDNDFKRAIQEGISKINIFTDINVAAVEAEFRKFETMNKGIIDLIPAAVEAVKQETLKKMMLFSSNGKGTLNQPSQDELVKAVVQEVLRELGRK